MLALIYLPFIPASGLKKECRVQRGHSLGLCISSDGIVVSAITFYNGKLIMALDSSAEVKGPTGHFYATKVLL